MFTAPIFAQTRSYRGLDVILKAFVLTATFTVPADPITEKQIAAAQCLPAPREAVTRPGHDG